MASRLERNMEDDRVVCQLVEVGDGGQENRGWCGHGDEFAGSNRRKDGEKRVVVVADGLDLYRFMGQCLVLRLRTSTLRVMGSDWSYLGDGTGTLGD